MKAVEYILLYDGQSHRIYLTGEELATEGLLRWDEHQLLADGQGHYESLVSQYGTKPLDI